MATNEAKEKDLAKNKKFDRSKFVDHTTIEQLHESDVAMDEVNKRKGSGTYASFLDIEHGMNKFRIYPPHPSDDESKPNRFIEARQTWMLPFDLEKKDEDGNVVVDKKNKPVLERKNKPVFDARIHAENKENDIVNIYLETLIAKLKEDGLKDEDLKKRLIPVYGIYTKTQKSFGIIGKPEWIMYAAKITGETKKFGRLSVGKAVKQRINAIVSMEAGDEPISTESNVNPLTEVDGGRLLKIKYNKDADKPQDYYTTEIDNSTMPMKMEGGRIVNVLATYPLSDADLEEFMKYPPLTPQYKNKYTKRDFDLAIKGLTLFDDINEYGIFQYDEFLEKVNQMREIYPDPIEEETAEGEAGSAEVGGDEFATMDREALKEFARTNKTGVFVVQKMEDEDIRVALRAWREKHPAEKEEEDFLDKAERLKKEGEKPEGSKSAASSLKSRAASVKKETKK